MIFYESPTSLLRWDERQHCMVLERKEQGYSTGGNFQMYFEKVIELTKLKGATKFVAIATKMKVMSEEDQAWLAEVWQLQVVAAGLRYWVFTKPVSAVAQISLKLLISKLDKIECKIFETNEEAFAWLAKK
jgi:hypothetical protein